MDDLARFRVTFFEECAELLSGTEAILAGLDPDAPSREDLNAIFRAVHSIKGGAGAFGLRRLVAFTHEFESQLDALRDGRGRLSQDGLDTIIRAFDVLSDLVAAARADREMEHGRDLEMIAVLAGLGWSGPAPTAAAPVEARAAAGVGWRILFRPFPDLFRHANEPLLLLRALKALGPIRVQCDASALPDLDALDPEGAYLAWTIALDAAVSEADVREVFEFVEGDCALDIRPLTDPAPEAGGAVAVRDAPPASESAARDGASEDRARQRAAAGGEAPVQAATTIRVELDRIDRLVNMVGEMVITQAMLAEQAERLPVDRYPQLIAGLEQLAHYTRDLQEGVMAIRAQPVKSVFQRMPRLVRELAAALDKDVRLVTIGENTEVDKTVIEQLSDPLTHMIRNSVDHGIESPERRRAAGKPEEGTITLAAEHASGRIVISIADDGRGLDRERVRAKAIERGLIDPDAAMSDEEIDQLIFLPGFSTAEAVSNVSGRGVGMDVVKRNIQALGGRIHLESRPGQGSRFMLSLPLTLAVLDGMIVTVGGERYVVPVTNIVESLRPRAADLGHLGASAEVLSIRGEYVALVHLHRVFGIGGAIEDPSRGLVVLVEIEGRERFGLVVDEMLGQQQVVIKSMEGNYGAIDGVSAATILGDGRVALILDVAGLRHATQRRRPAAAQAA
jgi:two-component system chemotaxis sensor kinase CheA